MTMKVGVIGLGTIGKPIALRILQGGFPLAVYDVRHEPVEELAAAGAIACSSSAEVAARSDLIISLVLDAAQTDDVVSGAKGILHSIRPGSLFATGSTLGREPVLRIAKALAEKGCASVDMPITGGYLAASDGKLVLMLGGDEAAIVRAEPVFKTFAHIITRVGGLGAGQAAKLAHQLIMSVNVLGLLEGLSLGAAGGVDPEIMKQIIRDGIANSTVLAMWQDMGPRWKKMLEPAAPGSALPNMRKDLHTALELARELGLALPVGDEVSRVADAGVATGHANPRL